MARTTAIEWADATINPVIGCSKVSPACKHCYAENISRRFGMAEWGEGVVRTIRIDKALDELGAVTRRAARERRTLRVFIGSMCDVFEDRADLLEMRKRLWDALHALPNSVVVMLLTKRPGVMASWAEVHGWPRQAWAGITAENQEWFDRRVALLREVPAPIRFLSCEPLLGPLELRRASASPPHAAVPIDWVIAGGETGTRARPSHPHWFRYLRAQCNVREIPFFFKQWGRWKPALTRHGLAQPRLWMDWDGKAYPSREVACASGCDPDSGLWVARIGRKGDRLLDGQVWEGVPHRESW